MLPLRLAKIPLKILSMKLSINFKQFLRIEAADSFSVDAAVSESDRVTPSTLSFLRRCCSVPRSKASGFRSEQAPLLRHINVFIFGFEGIVEIFFEILN